METAVNTNPNNQHMSDHKITPVRCLSTDPNACQHCHEFLAIPGNRFCPLHAGVSQINVTREGLYQLKRTEIARRLQNKKTNPESRTLTSELALLRLTLEDLLNKCEDDYDLVTQEAAIGRLVTAITQTLTANTKIEERVGELLSADHVVTLIQMFFEIVKEYVPRVEDQEEIAVRVNALLTGSTPVPIPVYAVEAVQGSDAFVGEVE